MVHEKAHIGDTHSFIKQSLKETLLEQRTRAPFLAQGLVQSPIQVPPPRKTQSHNSSVWSWLWDPSPELNYCLINPNLAFALPVPKLSKTKMLPPTNQPAAWMNYEGEKSTLSSACGTIIIPCMLLQEQCHYQKHHACKNNTSGNVARLGVHGFLSVWKINQPRCLLCCCLP